jgi:hypothetical protein
MVLYRVCSLLRTQAKSAVEDKGQRYCVCLGPNDGRWMIGCDECEDWFHGGYVFILFFVYCVHYMMRCYYTLEVRLYTVCGVQCDGRTQTRVHCKDIE